MNNLWEELEEKLRAELALTKSKAEFVKNLATGDDGGYISEYIAERFIEQYGNEHNIYKPNRSDEYYTVFDDIVIYGEMLKEKAMETLEEDWDDYEDDEDHTNDTCVEDPMRFSPGHFYYQM